MHDLALEQVGDRRQADVRVRADVDPHARGEARRAHVVEEDEGADHAMGVEGQDAPHLESAQVLAPGVDDEVDHAGSSGWSLARWGLTSPSGTAVEVLTLRMTMRLCTLATRPSDRTFSRRNASKACMSRVITRIT